MYTNALTNHCIKCVIILSNNAKYAKYIAVYTNISIHQYTPPTESTLKIYFK